MPSSERAKTTKPPNRGLSFLAPFSDLSDDDNTTDDEQDEDENDNDDDAAVAHGILHTTHIVRWRTEYPFGVLVGGQSFATAYCSPLRNSPPAGTPSVGNREDDEP